MAEFIANFRLADGSEIAEQVEAADIDAATNEVESRLQRPTLVVGGFDERERIVLNSANVVACEVTTPDLYGERTEGSADVVMEDLEHQVAGAQLFRDS